MGNKKPVHPGVMAWPYTAAERCKWLKAMDEYYGTPKNSPLHHDQRCTLMYRGDEVNEQEN